MKGITWTNEEDRWKWGLEESGLFSVKSSYAKLEALVLREDLWRVGEKGIFSKLWKSPAPSKVVAFSWKLLDNRIPTRLNLAVRNVLPIFNVLPLMDAPTSCAFCERVDESSIHLFLHCDVAGKVWKGIMEWWERVQIIPPNLFVLWVGLEWWREE